MRERFSIIGKELPEEDIKEVRGLIEKARAEYLKPVEGEIEKNPDELRLITLINEYLNQELEKLGIDKKISVPPEAIHILEKEAYQERYPKDTNATSAIEESAAFINNGTMDNRWKKYIVIAHEIIHLASWFSIYAEKKEKLYRLHSAGYRYEHDSESDHFHFHGLNEAVTQKMAEEFFHDQRQRIIRDFKFTPGEKRKIKPAYRENIAVLDLVISKIAQSKNEDPDSVWQRMKRGYFSGEKMHLRDIEKVFGKGSLRVLGAMSSQEKELPGEDMDELFVQFFEAEDDTERERIAKKILSERERFRYIKRRES